MRIEALIATYGYWLIAGGTFFEGETIAALGGAAAHQGYLELIWVVAAAFAGTFVGDQVYYVVGRRYGGTLLARRESWRSRSERAFTLLRRYDAMFILGFRFLYGLRTVSPFVIGMSGVPPVRFLVLNMIAAVVWASAICVAGFLFSNIASLVIANMKEYRVWVLVALALFGFLIWVRHLLRMRRRRREHSRAG